MKTFQRRRNFKIFLQERNVVPDKRFFHDTIFIHLENSGN